MPNQKKAKKTKQVIETKGPKGLHTAPGQKKAVKEDEGQNSIVIGYNNGGGTGQN